MESELFNTPAWNGLLIWLVGNPFEAMLVCFVLGVLAGILLVQFGILHVSQ
jgi:hypothetical protein